MATTTTGRWRLARRRRPVLDAAVARELTGLLGWAPIIRPSVRVEAQDVVVVTARPGTGGRRRRAPRGVDSEATRELRTLLGQPTVLRHAGTTVEVYEIDAEGTGLVGVRLSSQDVQHGETALGQAKGILDMCDAKGLRPRKLVVSLRCNSTVEYEDRVDWALVREGADGGWLRWVAYREADRVSRNDLAAKMFFRDLRRLKVDLWLAATGRIIDLDNAQDVFVLSLMTGVGAFEGAQILNRTQPPIRHRWLEEGRGWPKEPRFGFRRDAQDYVEIDPVQWPWVQRIHFDFAAMDQLGGSSLRRFADQMKALGCPISKSSLHRILRDRIYVTGEWTSTYAGQTYPCRPIQIPDPIPQEIFDRNQALLARVKGAQRRKPIGYYALGRVRLLHKGCTEHATELDASNLLRGSREGYRHREFPTAGCRGFCVPRKALDDLVIAKLLELCESEEMQREWAARVQRNAASDGVPDRADVAEIERQLRLRREQLGQLNREWLDSLDATPGALETFGRATNVLAGEVASLERALEHARRLTNAKDRVTAEQVRQGLVQRAREVLTLDVPADADLAQRRALFISAALSEVIVDFDGDELTVQMRGPLIPATADPGSEWLTLAAESSPVSALSRRARSTGQCGFMPAWESPLLVMTIETGRARYLAAHHAERTRSTLEMLRDLSEVQPPGRVALTRLPTSSRFRAAGYTVSAVQQYVTDRFSSTPAAWRVALGGETALRLGRVAPETVDEWTMVIRWAAENGLRFDRGWELRWAAMARDVAWLPDTSYLRSCQRTLRFRLPDIIAALSVSMGDLGEGRRFEACWRPSTLEDCYRALRVADSRLPDGRLRWDLIGKATNHDDSVPTVETIRRRIFGSHQNLRQAMLTALGTRASVTRGRVAPHTTAEWRILVEFLLDHGLDAAVPTVSWEEIRSDRPWVVAASWFQASVPDTTFSAFVRATAAQHTMSVL
jgi:hypothetical protein